MTTGLVWAQSANGVIGKGGVMPWHVPEDLAHFKAVTLDGGAVIMGRKTWDSLPERFRPLPGRRNIVITRQADWSADGVDVVHSLADALALAGVEQRAWVIGGAEIYGLAIGQADRLEVTEIRAEFDGDTLAPAVDAGWQLAAVDPADGWHTSRTGLDYRFLTYERG